ncbi:hypothetical protein [Heyndrickxia camelliae]|uniref:Uncharacterized protein n=1 Tax=Heyndrickxia camelliae TaxID=1707093 RepID=A0A2N3LK69_9BACI|nr:hypothetical protein [Heyndrickxia camelliae]PKR85032.1 hypothetical protein CWO92_11765 [Heyndrickxia camelliae]
MYISYTDWEYYFSTTKVDLPFKYKEKNYLFTRNIGEYCLLNENSETVLTDKSVESLWNKSFFENKSFREVFINEEIFIDPYYELTLLNSWGREIEFTYKNQQYIFANTTDGCGLIGGLVDTKYYKTPQESWNNAKINGISFYDLYKNGEVQIDFIL